jgi:hypothetical protein
MRSPFPDMDPWLELPTLWLDVHNSMITAIRDDMASRVAPKYHVGVEQRTYLSILDARSFVGRAAIVISRTKSRKGGGLMPVSSGATLTGARVLKLDVEVPIRD